MGYVNKSTYIKPCKLRGNTIIIVLHSKGLAQPIVTNFLGHLSNSVLIGPHCQMCRAKPMNNLHVYQILVEPRTSSSRLSNIVSFPTQWGAFWGLMSSKHLLKICRIIPNQYIKAQSWDGSSLFGINRPPKVAAVKQCPKTLSFCPRFTCCYYRSTL